MKVAVVGAGNGGTAVATDLAYRGHEVALIKTSKSIHDDNFNYLLDNAGHMTLDEFGQFKSGDIACVTRDLSAVRGCPVVILYVQTNYHEQVIERLAPFMEDDQVLLINPGYLSTAYALKHIKKNIMIAEATSSFIDCRIKTPGIIKVGFRNVRNPIGIYPKHRREEAIALLDQLGFPLAYVDSVVETALHNPNMIVHTVGAVMSIPRVEKTEGDYCMYHEVFTPSVWNILERLDGEKMDVLEHLGLPRLPYVEACKFRNSLDDDRDAKEVFFWYAGMPTRAKGPTSVESRYITEDVSQGLVMLEALGKTLGIATPIATSLIELASAALGRNMRAGGRTLERLGRENIRLILEDCGIE